MYSPDFVSDKLISIIVYLLLKMASVCIELVLKTFTVQLYRTASVYTVKPRYLATFRPGHNFGER